ncbi:inositol monophosphatase family protein [Cellulomonas bogoriensis]|uniref:Inositol monophosphatase n=1 Tax=Cellulomonas bogoriensis 69B4 = DSM 16987 TaxID=1386082 RepID=A0A0A0BP32_9CELL|nr:inositol monophosphatase [Cellulomonas bogoriensis]KGM09700.1 inositol monophosphatase [Cellulomonas bogoriensis 69B4 = DSM 16987]
MTDLDAVTALVEEVARTVVAPRFRHLAESDVSEKAPGDLVTVVDQEAEVALTRGLTELTPGVPVVGEEAVAADPRILDAVTGAPRAWVVDPVDGTRAFVEGIGDYAVMVGLVDDGEAVAGWICLPEHGTTYVAERGSGAYLSGRRLTRPAPDSRPRAQIATRYLPRRVRRRILEGIETSTDHQIAPAESLWSGREYSRLATGEIDAMVSWRTWPWDHVPGVVLMREVGGVARRLDGSPYRPGTPADGLINAADEDTFDKVRTTLGLAPS